MRLPSPGGGARGVFCSFCFWSAIECLRIDSSVDDAADFAPFPDLDALHFELAGGAPPATGLFARHPRLKRLGFFRPGDVPAELEALLNEPGRYVGWFNARSVTGYPSPKSCVAKSARFVAAVRSTMIASQ